MSWRALTVLLLCPLASAQTLRFADLDEQTFHPLESRIAATLDGARIDSGEDAVSVLINGEPVNADDITVRNRTVIVAAVFMDGVNDVLVTARTAGGGPARADALIWAGSHTLIVDVVNTDMTPVENASVRVSLASNTAVAARSRATHGSARFENLPDARLLVEATARDGRKAAAGVSGAAGSLLLTLESR